MKVCGVILAAGRSSRLGRPKQLLELDGKPLVRIVAERALASRLDDVVLVTGAHAEEVEETVAGLPLRVERNPDYERGQSTSLRAGLATLPADADAVVFLLGDQPEVTTAAIDAVLARFEEGGAAIVQAAYGGRPSHPIVFARQLFPELERVTGDEGGRSVVQRHPAALYRVAIADSAPPGDVDTLEDFAALVYRWAERSNRAEA